MLIFVLRKLNDGLLLSALVPTVSRLHTATDVRKNDDCLIQNKELCVKHDEFCSEWHKKHAPGLGCEIVFASSDKDSAEFKEYFGTMPWLAIPFKEKSNKQQKLNKQ